MAEHSATPWQLCHHLESAEKDASCKCGYRGGIWGNDGEILVCEMRNCDLHEGHEMTPVGDRATQLANAAFIIRAVNSYDDLREALECAKIKLSRYREQHQNSYIGGVAAEYDAVVARIDAALASCTVTSNLSPPQRE